MESKKRISHKTKKSSGRTPHSQYSEIMTGELQQRTAEQWQEMGKEALILLSNSFNMNVKGMSTNELAAALVEKFRSPALDNNDEENNDDNVIGTSDDDDDNDDDAGPSN